MDEAIIHFHLNTVRLKNLYKLDTEAKGSTGFRILKT